MAKKTTHRETLLQNMAAEAAADPQPDAAVPETETPPQAPEQAQEQPLPVEQAPQPAVPGETEQATAGLVERLASLGFQDVADEASGQQRILEAYEQNQRELESLRKERERLEQLATYGTRYLSELQTRQGQAAPATPQPTAKPDEPPYVEAYHKYLSPPSLDVARVQQYRELNATTNEYEWKKNTPAELRASASAYEDWVRNWQDGIALRPHEVLPPVILGILHEHREEISRMLSPVIDQTYQQYQQQLSDAQFLAEIERDNADLLYVKDPRTNQHTQQLTPEGEQIVRYIQQAAGLPTIQDRWNYARVMLADQLAQSGQQVQQTQEKAQDVAAQKRREHIQRTQKATSIPSRGGSVARKESGQTPRPQNNNTSYGRQLLEQMEVDGVGTL